MPKLSSDHIGDDNLVLVHYLNSIAIVDREDLNRAYNSAIDFFRTLLPSIQPQDTHRIKLMVQIHGNIVAVSPRAWTSFCRNRSITDITLIQRRPTKTLVIYVETLTGGRYTLNVASTSTVYDVKLAVESILDECTDDHKLLLDGSQLIESQSLRSYGIDSESTVLLVPTLRGGKPVIYLTSPIQIDATVRVSLTKDWSFSALYPVVPSVPSRSGESATWNVQVRPDGVLQEIDSGTEVPYLFWEALTNTASISTTEDGQMSPPPSPLMSNGFNPCRANSLFSAQTCVALTIKDTPQYLDRALKDLGLNIEARASFITYWLPSFLKHENILLTFVSMDAYEKAAPLDVSPAPDVVTRVFMVFKRLCSEELDLWEESRTTPVEEWRNVIGVPTKELQDDARLFRVLEWGGMEVV
ncbi:hypothetical protein CYLTODRAFT_494168 [Cylindrobasidium torrendii FP15055 ss-10]|uniref:Ubiquitin-like domain-containing protein n=1 Tax=Cylindrobasidium torrendii FP15055 ss-10 TaxID=1314674 RepID=A0A0D7AXK4_9AGAR|nr:hypothetical protein CYLTODRAFT_494168 [Cylindrobasidium torrendii FP15055 ss-10]